MFRILPVVKIAELKSSMRLQPVRLLSKERWFSHVGCQDDAI